MQKVKKYNLFLGTLEGQEVRKEVEIEELEKLDKIVNDSLKAITKKELLLLMKLEETKEILENEKYEYIQTD